MLVRPYVFLCKLWTRKTFRLLFAIHPSDNVHKCQNVSKVLIMIISGHHHFCSKRQTSVLKSILTGAWCGTTRQLDDNFLSLSVCQKGTHFFRTSLPRARFLCFLGVVTRSNRPFRNYLCVLNYWSFIIFFGVIFSVIYSNFMGMTTLITCYKHLISILVITGEILCSLGKTLDVRL